MLGQNTEEVVELRVTIFLEGGILPFPIQPLQHFYDINPTVLFEIFRAFRFGEIGVFILHELIVELMGGQIAGFEAALLEEQIMEKVIMIIVSFESLPYSGGVVEPNREHKVDNVKGWFILMEGSDVLPGINLVIHELIISECYALPHFNIK